ncbi:kinetochore-associated protein NSL1 homolog [Nelusetta ayraudi]|uniref:kinetochore-associated protein NSL1 homolog n=1 Tax=Nelusetta ayraudi TaxID=303726 RepID=UPI003F706113
MDDGQRDEAAQDFRVRASSKREVSERLDRCKDLLRTAMDGQPEVDEDSKRVVVQELLANFEAAVTDNILVGVQCWDQAPDEEAADVEAELDELLVEATWRRRTFPRQIVPHVVHGLKAERKLMELLQERAPPLELPTDPSQESLMRELTAAAPGLVRQTAQAVQAIRTLQLQAEGLSQVLDLQPSAASLQVHHEVLGTGSQPDACRPSEGGAGGHRQPIRRAVEEAAAAGVYGCI